MLIGAGDIAGTWAEDEASAQVLDQVVAANPDATVFTLGDNAYPNGSASDFSNYYAPTWGRHVARTLPVPGNHDWVSVNPYFDYFYPKNSSLNSYDPTRRGYYSYDRGAWHIIALNSGDGGPISQEQLSWLQHDLANSAHACTLAYWHHPRFSSNMHGNNANTAPIWDLLYQYGADVVMTGHDHGYERFDPQNPSGQPDPTGIRSFVAGIGGAGSYTFGAAQPNSVVRGQGVFGALKLTLHETSYDWQLVKIASQQNSPISDSGTGDCYTSPTRGSTPTISTPNPIGSFDVATPTLGGARVSGWAIDREMVGKINVHMYVDGVLRSTFDAKRDRPDVAKAFPGYGSLHGFDEVVAVPPGFHTLCAYGINHGEGDNSLIGCRWVNVGVNPFGSFDSTQSGPSLVTLSGWAIDPDSADPIETAVYVDGQFATNLVANQARPDVGSAYAGYGDAHGINHSVPIGPGFHTVCTYGINQGPGNNTLIACRWVMIETNPFGSIDFAQSEGGGVRVAGWAVDPQTAAAITVHVYVDGNIQAAFQADADRTDVGQALPLYGSHHGFNALVGTPPGSHTICAYGLNVGEGSNSLIGCRNF